MLQLTVTCTLLGLFFPALPKCSILLKMAVLSKGKTELKLDKRDQCLVALASVENHDPDQRWSQRYYDDESWLCYGTSGYQRLLERVSGSFKVMTGGVEEVVPGLIQPSQHLINTNEFGMLGKFVVFMPWLWGFTCGGFVEREGSRFQYCYPMILVDQCSDKQRITILMLKLLNSFYVLCYVLT